MADREPTQTDYDDEVYAEGSYSGSSYAADYPNAQPQRSSAGRGMGGYKTTAMVADTLNKCVALGRSPLRGRLICCFVIC